MIDAQLLPAELGQLGPHELLINEIFHSIQGESTHAGKPCLFFRLTGCHLRCTWCDSEYAFHEGTRTTVAECLERAERTACPLIEVTGGEPLLQPAVYPLLESLCDRGFEVLLETSGAVPIDRVDARVRRIVDWKCPGSGMAGRNRESLLGSLRQGDELKLVLLDRRDYEWARDFLRRLPASLTSWLPVLFSPVTGALPSAELSAWILADRLRVRLNLQLHKWIWEPTRRGV